MRVYIYIYVWPAKSFKATKVLLSFNLSLFCHIILLIFEEIMKGRLGCLFILVVFIQIGRWVSATSRPFHGLLVHQSSGQLSPPVPQPSPPNLSSMQGFKLKKKMMKEEEESRKIGSTPPSCEHKCYGCVPCEAIQVPTNTHLGVEYANYEPEGWKCKCGPSFYSP